MFYVYLSFHTNYFAPDDEPEKHRLFGFTVEDPNGTVKESLDNDDIGGGLCESIEEIIEGTFDFVTSGTNQIFGGGAYEVGEENLHLIRKAVLHVWKTLISFGGIVGPILEFSGENPDVNFAELINGLGVEE